MSEMYNMLGDLSSTIYLVYDISQLSLDFSHIVSGFAGFARPQSAFEAQLKEYAVMILVGSSTLISVAAKTAARLAPNKPTLLFETQEEALAYAQAEMAKQR
ncbi:MAG: hypothetical protein JXB07_16470 [Anaerolineae bacterium]|nr:hypothetical protein [Anaerolineae bacterium]